MLGTGRGRLAVISLFALVALLAAHSPAAAATITIVNLDDPGEGLNDPTQVFPEGGNSGTTLGEQRLIGLQHAATLWAEALHSTVEILIAAKFDPLGGSAVGALLGSAGPKSTHRDFPGAPLAETYYPAALANSLARGDLNPAKEDIRATFNSDVDGFDVLGPITFYYGLDGVAGADVDFVTIALHELAHGLGFLSLIKLGTGELKSCSVDPDGCDDSYTRWLVDDNFVPADLSSMDDSQRQAAIIDEPDLLWSGPNVVQTSGGLTNGVAPDGRVEIYAPAPVESGSSVSHFSDRVAPNELMEPAYTSANHDTALTVALMLDLGWAAAGAASTTTTVPSTTTTTTSSTSSTLPATTTTSTVPATTTTTVLATTTTMGGEPDCGDANEDGDITPTDAHLTLRTSVSLAACDPHYCDVDASGKVTSTDAHRILRKSVGQTVLLICP